MDERKSSTPFLLLPLQAELIGRLRWFIQLRWLAAFGVLCTVLAAKYIFGFGQLKLTPLLILVGFIIGLNLMYALHLARSFPQPEIREEKDLRRAQMFALAQIWFDLILLTLMIHFAGGVENPFSFFYIFHVILSSILLAPRYAITTTIFAVALYGGMMLLEDIGMAQHHSLINIQMSLTYHFAVFFAFSATMFIAAFVTVSVRRELGIRESEAEEARNAVESLEAQKSGFMRLVSHELRSPIAAIQSSLGVVMNLGADCLDDALRASLERAMNRAEDLFNLTKDLIEYSRLSYKGKVDQSELIELDLNRLVRDSAGVYENQANERQINFKLELPAEPVMIVGDPRSLNQIAGNLISNAIRYTQGGGNVLVRLENLGARVLLQVSDTGIGIPEEDLDRIGTEFYRSPNAKQFAPSGTGIGMRIVKEAVRQHGGTIRIDSKKGEGTTFKVEIPVN